MVVARMDGALVYMDPCGDAVRLVKVVDAQTEKPLASFSAPQGVPLESVVRLTPATDGFTAEEPFDGNRLIVITAVTGAADFEGPGIVFDPSELGEGAAVRGGSFVGDLEEILAKAQEDCE